MTSTMNRANIFEAILNQAIILTYVPRNDPRIDTMRKKYSDHAATVSNATILGLAVLKYYFPHLTYKKIHQCATISVTNETIYQYINRMTTVGKKILPAKLEKFIVTYFTHRCVHLGTFTMGDIYDRFVQLGYSVDKKMLAKKVNQYFREKPYYIFEKKGVYTIYGQCDQCGRNFSVSPLAYSGSFSPKICVECSITKRQDFWRLNTDNVPDLTLKAHHFSTEILLEALKLTNDDIANRGAEWITIKDPRMFYDRLKEFMQTKVTFDSALYYQYLYAKLQSIYVVYDPTNADAIAIPAKSNFDILL